MHQCNNNSQPSPPPNLDLATTRDRLLSPPVFWNWKDNGTELTGTVVRNRVSPNFGYVKLFIVSICQTEGSRSAGTQTKATMESMLVGEVRIGFWQHGWKGGRNEKNGTAMSSASGLPACYFVSLAEGAWISHAAMHINPSVRQVGRKPLQQILAQLKVAINGGYQLQFPWKPESASPQDATFKFSEEVNQ